MNKEYIYKDGKALVIDENDNQRTVDYCDNLDDVLVQENLIETMEKEIKNLEKEISGFKKESKFSKYLNILWPFLIFTLGPLAIMPEICNLAGVNQVLNLPLLGTLDFGIAVGILGSTAFSIPGTLMSLANYFKEKRFERDEKGKETQLEYLKKLLVEQKEDLEELKLDKSNTKTSKDFSVSRVDDIEALKKLKNYLSFYYNLGCNEEKYFKYYQKGKLDNHLARFMNEAGIYYANQHFEEKAPTLVKRKKENK